MPQNIPAIGEDVTALMGGDAPDIGADVTALMASHEVEQEPEPQKRNLLQEQIGFAERGEMMPMLAPLSVVGQAPGLLARLAQRVAPKLMRESMGAQTAVRKKFPTVDLDKVALREGAVPGSPASKLAIDVAASAAGRAVPAAGRAADAAGAAPVRISLDSLRQLHQRFGQAGMPDKQQQVVEAMRQYRRNVPGAQPVADALVAKTEWQNAAKGALQGAADPRTAGTNAKIARAIAGELAGETASRPGVGEALTKSQELMALQRAMQNADVRTPVLRNILSNTAGMATGGAVGAMAGGPMGAIIGAPLGAAAQQAATRAASSPRLLGALANRLNSVAPQNEQARQLLRAMLAEYVAARDAQP